MAEPRRCQCSWSKHLKMLVALSWRSDYQRMSILDVTTMATFCFFCGGKVCYRPAPRRRKYA